VSRRVFPAKAAGGRPHRPHCHGREEVLEVRGERRAPSPIPRGRAAETAHPRGPHGRYERFQRPGGIRRHLSPRPRSLPGARARQDRAQRADAALESAASISADDISKRYRTSYLRSSHRPIAVAVAIDTSPLAALTRAAELAIGGLSSSRTPDRSPSLPSATAKRFTAERKTS
jgi:hypothetical protein